MPTARKNNSPVASADEWVSAHEASRLSRLSRLALYERALSGELRTQKVAGRRVFARDEVEQLAPAVPA